MENNSDSSSTTSTTESGERQRQRRTTMETSTSVTKSTSIRGVSEASLRRASGWSTAAILMSVVGMACAPEMDPVSKVERTRVLGARVEVQGAPERASPAPGERATVRWLVTAPGELPPLGWAFVLCPGISGGNDLGCVGEPMAVFQGRNTAPEMTIEVPAQGALGGARELVLFGRVCEDSEPMLEAGTGRPLCAGGAEGTTAAVSIPLALEGSSNRNPRLGEDALTFNGQPWAALPATATCQELPQVKAATKDHVIVLGTAGSDRESFVAMMGDPPRPTQRREWLKISQFTTAGELDRAFSSVEAEVSDERPAVEMEWEAPAASEVTAAGEVVRFTFVARDMRGGVDWTTRAVCVTP